MPSAHGSDVVVARALMRSARRAAPVVVVGATARASVRMARSVVLALNNDAIVIAMMSVHKQSKQLHYSSASILSYSLENGSAIVTYESDKEKDAVHNAKGETGLQHGAGLVDMQRPWTITLTAIVAKWAER